MKIDLNEKNLEYKYHKIRKIWGGMHSRLLNIS